MLGNDFPFIFLIQYFRLNLAGDGLSGVGNRPVEIQWDSQKVLQKVLPPVKRNPALIPPDLRNKPPKVHVNYYPDTTTSTEAIPTPTRLYYTPPPRKNPQPPKKITPPPRKITKITPPPRRKITPSPPKKITTTFRKSSYFPKFPEYFPAESRPNTVDFARPSYNRRNDEQISLNTEYFIKKTDILKTTTQKSILAPSGGQTTRRKRRLTTLRPSSRIPVLVKKIAKRPILKSGNDKKKEKNNLCHGGVLECGSKKDNLPKKNGTEKNYVVSLYFVRS